MQPTLSVVIGTYNQRNSLEKVLPSLFEQTLAPELYEIVLVDSMSNDGTEELVRSFNPECDLNYIRVDNQGKSQARNTGIEAARGEIILLTDADMIADESLLEEHMVFHNRKKNACAEGLTYNLKSLENYKNQKNISPYIKEKINAGQKIKWAYFLSGNLSLKKSTLINAGLFDACFSGYGFEDLELGFRLSKMKVPLYYLPSAINYHYHIVSDQGMLERKYNMGISAAKFYLKHPNFEVKMFLGLNPLAIGIYKFLKTWPEIRGIIKNKYILEEFNYRKGIEDHLNQQGKSL